MEYKISGNDSQALKITLFKGEELFAVSNAKIKIDENIVEEPLMHGGIVGGIKRKIAGENIYLKKYSAPDKAGELLVHPKVPGRIAPVILNNQCVVCQTDSFICCESGINIDIVLAGRKIEGLPWRAGHFLEKISGTGMVFILAGSNLAEFDLTEEEKLRLLKNSYAGADLQYEGDSSLRTCCHGIETGKGNKPL